MRRRTLEEIRERGLQALRRELGRGDTIRFLQQFETGSGNYARERHAWVDSTTLDELRGVASTKRHLSKRRPRGRTP